MARTYPLATWRLIVTPAGDGAAHMAIDESVLEAVAAGNAPPTLRLYSWDPVCLSIGADQDWDVADLGRCAARGWDVVRRLSPGRAVLHVDELAYAVCLPLADARAGSGGRNAYERLELALNAALGVFGLEPSRARAVYQDRGDSGAACFDGPSGFQITIGQRKLVASAQVEHDGALLQHGSLPLAGDITRIAEALWFDHPGQRSALVARMGYRAMPLALAAGRPVSFDQAAEAFRDAFALALNVTLAEGELTAAEQARAAELRTTRYTSEAWLKRV